MVVKEAMRTFTYLNLYGYLTDAVVVNRLLPSDGYFAEWSDPAAPARAVRSAFEPVPVLTARYLEREVVGGRDARPARRRAVRRARPAELLHHELSQQLVTANGRPPCAWRSPSPRRAT